MPGNIDTTGSTGQTAVVSWSTPNGEYITFGNAPTPVGALINTPNPKAKDISPQLYFTYIKSKFGLLERRVLSKRLKDMEIAFNQAMENGQVKLGEKFYKELDVAMREAAIMAKGVERFIEEDDIRRYKRSIRGGHISDTEFSEFTRTIPNKVMKRKKELDGLFDGYVIYHYWNEEAEKVRAGKQKMTPAEKEKMRDPVLFGRLNGTDRLYFIAEWEDEFCDLSFDELAAVVAGKKKLGHHDAFDLKAHPSSKTLQPAGSKG